MSNPISEADAATFSQLAKDLAPDNTTNTPLVNIPSGWQPLITSTASSESNYFGIAFVNTTTGQIVIASRGTEITSAQDLSADLQIANGDVPTAEFTDAQNFYQQVVNEAENEGYSNYQVIETGYSLGGADAQYIAGKQEGVYAMTFNAPGIADLSGIDLTTDGSLVTNWVVPNEAIANYGTHFGSVQNLSGNSLYEDILSQALDDGNLAAAVYADLQLHSLTPILQQLGVSLNNGSLTNTQDMVPISDLLSSQSGLILTDDSFSTN